MSIDSVSLANHHHALGERAAARRAWPQAAQAFRQAIAFAPAQAPSHFQLGQTLRHLGHWADALAAFEEAARLEPNVFDYVYHLAVNLHEQGDLQRAVDSYQRALTLKPGDADASCQLAIALKEQGRLEEAVAQFQETLKLKPNDAVAFYNLSELAAEGRYSFAPQEVDCVKHMMVSQHLPAFERSLCGFVLGGLAAKRGAHDEAFGYYREANELRYRLLVDTGQAFDTRKHSAVVDRIIAGHGPSYFERVKKWGTASDLPIFIIGMPRSGSTLVEQILASHPKVCGGGEIGEIYRFITQFWPEQEAEAYTKPLLPNLRETRKLAEDYLGHLRRRAQGAERVTIKTLENFLHVGAIVALFPKARIIHCKRDALDTCLSCYFQSFQNISFAYTLPDIGAYYRDYERLMAHWARVLPGVIHEVSYEELTANQEAVTRRLLDYCGLLWDKRCLEFFKTRRDVQTASTIQVRKPMSRQAVGRWQKYRAHLAPLFEALGIHPE